MSAIRARLGVGRQVSADDSGFTLIEMLMAMVLFSIVGALLLSTLVTSERTGRKTRNSHDLNEEARVAINRMAREIRQAVRITKVVNPDGPAHSTTALTAMTFEADFNGDGCAGNACAGTDLVNNPETVTYCFDPSASDATIRTQIRLIPGSFTGTPDCAQPGSLAIMAGKVTGFELKYRSNAYRYDANGDGATTWMELEDAPPPVGDPGSPDGDINTNELTSLNSVVVDLTLSNDGSQQAYRTQVDLRNRS